MKMKQIPGRLHGVLLLAVVWGGVACSSAVEKASGWLSSGADVIAVTPDRVLWGSANFAQDRRATLDMHSADALPPLRCFGALRYTATSSGVIDMSCNDGRQFVLPFQALSPLSGTARGVGDMAAFGLTYGLLPDKAAGYLRQPSERLQAPKSPAATSPPPASGGG